MHIATRHCTKFAQVGMALTFAASSLKGQAGTPWLAGSVGVGTAYIGNTSAAGLAADISGGLTVMRGIRIGARFVRVTSVDIAGDQPGWSAQTLLGIASYTFDSAFTLSSGLGRMTTRQKDSSISG